MQKSIKVMVSGCFDLMHPGHIKFLQDASELGDVLIVCIGSDRTIHSLKGKPPYFDEHKRQFKVESLSVVDRV